MFKLKVIFLVHIFIFSLFLPYTVTAQSKGKSFCKNVPWFSQVNSNGWHRQKPVLFESQIYNGWLYIDNKKKKQVVVDIYNTAIGGKIKIIRDIKFFYVQFSYSVYFESTTNNVLSKSLILAKYSVQGLNNTLWCQELLDGDNDRAASVARDTLDYVIEIAAKTFDSEDEFVLPSK